MEAWYAPSAVHRKNGARFALLTCVVEMCIAVLPAAAQQPPSRKPKEVVLVIDSGITWGGWSYGSCADSSDPFACDWQPLFVPSRWPEFLAALGASVEDPSLVPQDGSVSIAVVQGAGAAYTTSGRDWLSGPTLEIPLTVISSAQDAANLAVDIRSIQRFAGPFGQCEPTLDGSACFPFKQFLPGVGLDVAVDHLTQAGSANTLDQTVCLVGDVDSGGGWFGFFGPGSPPSRTVGDAHRAGFVQRGRRLRVVDLRTDSLSPWGPL